MEKGVECAKEALKSRKEEVEMKKTEVARQGDVVEKEKQRATNRRQ